jgi:hypothetical protein
MIILAILGTIAAGLFLSWACYELTVTEREQRQLEASLNRALGVRQ